ncbi:hypothetical protein [Couchioplanes caeruleus]|uniref:DUF4190 domain-containing protein n=2 Tax=Couchioplanes caeruleus TaxID=56438 RepID=A0A1K0FDG3_9ACTN|nr:hypothetical protein [Couchioplanes caeruleus]OJF10784.1 hypothetical protein BG844_30135 [Couchioplanes caeruleus subsp. caeruleus]ROP32242.1 hypothetical protein EDD30_5178 [Couchioplanes caeruleus]
MRIPTFSRQSHTTTDTVERPAVAARPGTTDPDPTDPGAGTAPPATGRATPDRATADRARTDRMPVERDARPAGAPVAPGPKPRSSLLATLALITGVAGALLVLSGSLLGYGIGVAGLALVLSIAGVRATGRRHVAGKTDALIGMVLALFAIVVGILALTGSLSWLGTDMQPAGDLRQWLDSQFVNRM